MIAQNVIVVNLGGYMFQWRILLTGKKRGYFRPEFVVEFSNSETNYLNIEEDYRFNIYVELDPNFPTKIEDIVDRLPDVDSDSDCFRNGADRITDNTPTTQLEFFAFPDAFNVTPFRYACCIEHDCRIFTLPDISFFPKDPIRYVFYADYRDDNSDYSDYIIFLADNFCIPAEKEYLRRMSMAKASPEINPIIVTSKDYDAKEYEKYREKEASRRIKID